jgi:hypothetical protein
MCDRVGNQQLALEGSYEGKVANYFRRYELGEVTRGSGMVNGF